VPAACAGRLGAKRANPQFPLPAFLLLPARSYEVARIRHSSFSAAFLQKLPLRLRVNSIDRLGLLAC
jgi:hypothetical protein